jgi:hypothetical protein
MGLVLKVGSKHMPAVNVAAQASRRAIAHYLSAACSQVQSSLLLLGIGYVIAACKQTIERDQQICCAVKIN